MPLFGTLTLKFIHIGSLGEAIHFHHCIMTQIWPEFRSSRTPTAPMAGISPSATTSIGDRADPAPDRLPLASTSIRSRKGHGREPASLSAHGSIPPDSSGTSHPLSRHQVRSEWHAIHLPRLLRAQPRHQGIPRALGRRRAAFLDGIVLPQSLSQQRLSLRRGK